VLMPNRQQNDFPTPTGTGFFVSPDGLFVTARHVVCDLGSDSLRPALGRRGFRRRNVWEWLDRPPSAGPRSSFSRTPLSTSLFDFDLHSSQEDLKSLSGFPHVEVSRRSLEEGEPVYAFGYPLPEGEIREAGEGILVGTTTLRPRTTSAIVASTIEESGPIITSSDPLSYVLDKALNYGNSGGPILAEETGRVHAVCTRFQPVAIRQPHLRDEHGTELVIQIPSLYGVVSSLGNPKVLTFLEEQGAPVPDD
jgi:serine protease Do